MWTIHSKSLLHEAKKNWTLPYSNKTTKGNLAITILGNKTSSESSDNIKRLQRSYATRLGAWCHFTSLLVCASSLDHCKHLFIYAFPRKNAFGINSTIKAQHHATGSCGAFGHCQLVVAFPRGFTDGTGGTLKRILLGDFIVGYFSYAAWLVTSCYVILSLSIAIPLIGAHIPAVFGHEFKHLSVHAFSSKNVLVPQRYAKIRFWACRVGQSGFAGFLWSTLTSRTPEIIFCWSVYLWLSSWDLGHLSFAAWLVAQGQAVSFLPSLALPFHVAHTAAIFSQQFTHLSVDAFARKNVFIPQRHAEISFRTRCVGQACIARFLGSGLTSWAPEIIFHCIV